MGSTSDLRTHQSILRMKNIGVHLLQRIPPEIIVSVTGRILKALRINTGFLHSMNDL